MKYLHDPTKTKDREHADIPIPVEGILGTIVAVAVHIGGEINCAIEKYDACPANDPDTCPDKWCMSEFTCPDDYWI